MLASFPAEWRRYTDSETGAAICQWTSAETMNHHFYFTNWTLAPDGGRGFFVSYRDGYPNLYAIDRTDGHLTQITSRVDINPFSPATSPSSAALYFSAQNAVYAVNSENGDVNQLAAFTGAQLGNCSLNQAGTHLAIGLRYVDYCELALIDLVKAEAEIVTRAPEIGHIQFSPRNDRLLLYSGPVDSRLWIYDCDKGESRSLYDQPANEWLVHESWRGGDVDELFVPLWPKSILALAPDGSGMRTVAEINAWHACSSPDGRHIVCDTNHPDRGLLLIDADSGAITTLCQPGASLRGSQWRHSEPAVGAGIDTSIIRSATPENDPPPQPDDPASTYGPQWSHPHPSFSRDGKEVVYTSDRDRWSHVYSVELAAD